MNFNLEKNINNSIQNNSTTAATIAAVSTPPGISGIAVIRLSGKQASAICDQLFTPLNQNFKRPSQMQPYTVGVGYWHGFEKSEILDQVVLTFFKAPHSYTGEDVYEISCHGGEYIKEAILQSLFDAGAEPAGPGEFSKRAFINGKLNLVEAEAVMDMISAESSRQNQVALQQLRGKLSDQISQLRDDLFQVIAQIEMIIEFPENEDTLEKRQTIVTQLKQVKLVLEQAVSSFSQGRIIREGFQVVIAGQPNVGKSSLLNYLLGEDKAIVTSKAGTTRDIVDARIIIDGLSVHLTDTAGLRLTDDIVEKEGINRAYQALEKADLVFYVLSPENPETWQQDLTEINLLLEKDKKIAVIAGKRDLSEHKELSLYIDENLGQLDKLDFSAFDDQADLSIKKYILQTFENLGKAESDSMLITHLRHRKILDQTLAQIEQAIQAFDGQIPLDIVSGLLQASAEILAELTGDEVSEELINTIFSEFCVGK
ncbi:MAG: tRNA uridine-5-carboxymethylaminomethyl(34) synthesis GTPase MnmE [Clostridiaceae bacterium]|nr:tRNA uridine-5-carboxymethylaminomethyl(34) synthesis GTPase MnmE [Clostridiaceae bacterium]